MQVSLRRPRLSAPTLGGKGPVDGTSAPLPRKPIDAGGEVPGVTALENRQPRVTTRPPQMNANPLAEERIVSTETQGVRHALLPLHEGDVRLGNDIFRRRERVERANGVTDRNRPRVTIVDAGRDLERNLLPTP